MNKVIVITMLLISLSLACISDYPVGVYQLGDIPASYNADDWWQRWQQREEAHQEALERSAIKARIEQLEMQNIDRSPIWLP